MSTDPFRARSKQRAPAREDPEARSDGAQRQSDQEAPEAPSEPKPSATERVADAIADRVAEPIADKVAEKLDERPAQGQPRAKRRSGKR